MCYYLKTIQNTDTKNRPYVILVLPFNFILSSSHLSVYIIEISSVYHDNAT